MTGKKQISDLYLYKITGKTSSYFQSFQNGVFCNSIWFPWQRHAHIITFLTDIFSIEGQKCSDIVDLPSWCEGPLDGKGVLKKRRLWNVIHFEISDGGFETFIWINDMVQMRYRIYILSFWWNVWDLWQYFLKYLIKYTYETVSFKYLMRYLSCSD